MSRNKIIANLRFARKEYMFHKSNDRGYPLKRALIEYFAKECLKYRDMLKATV
ncbi:hypothetical protein N5S76_06735 [Aliarcobacter cryaerophilus]|jgi:hypothetical protein|uniref:hypothetical protein n=1 Tax=Aliarcobacter cryaerophilus TaxID=28198 RepID=UPI0021B5FA67|nr:hypothetical protein [Aliarcobacter cryaerophilus]MCT7499461.1 hypothetical protein [Aliarcobacter cryaerophilus]